MAAQFEGLKVYYSGSIRGTPEPDTTLPWELVGFMANLGCDVLSEHVAARNQTEMDEIRARRVGQTTQELLQDPTPWFGIRRQDILWVDEADVFVALVNGASHGVGMEIQRAIDKPLMGMNRTPVLCLIRDELLPNLSFMVRGIDPNESPEVEIRGYSSTQQAQQIILDFLTRKN